MEKLNMRMLIERKEDKKLIFKRIKSLNSVEIIENQQGKKEMKYKNMINSILKHGDFFMNE
jgi:hypothetical protein